MKLTLKAYVVLASIAVVSFGTFLLAPIEHELVNAAIAAPGVTALLAALFQLMRDGAEHEKRLEAQRREFQFSLGATSHMANRAFDKHAEFCEKYMSEIHRTIDSLFRERDTETALVHSSNLLTLRVDYATWLTDDMNRELNEFESTLRRLGADAHFIEATRANEVYAKQRALRIDQNLELYGRLLGLPNGERIEQTALVDAVRTTVRAILAIEDLTRLREQLIKQAGALGA